MRTNAKIKALYKLLEEKAKTGAFISFTYAKANGEVSRRTMRIGVNIARTLERQGKPMKENSRGNWISNEGKRSGRRGYLIKRGGAVYISGTDVTNGKGEYKAFLLSGVSNLK